MNSEKSKKVQGRNLQTFQIFKKRRKIIADGLPTISKLLLNGICILTTLKHKDLNARNVWKKKKIFLVLIPSESEI